MPTRDLAPIGAPCWIDLFTPDTDRARAFYGELFGWTSERAGDDFGGYINFSKDGVMVAGCMKNDGSGPVAWSVYLATDDVKATVDAATERGASVIVPPSDVGDLGTMAVLVDPTGAAIGAWQPGEHKGFGVHAEPGTPGWFELHTRDYERAVGFYRDVFRWPVNAVSDTPEFKYTTYGKDEAALAGIMDASSFLPEGVPAHWAVYFQVEDTDATLARVNELAGQTLVPAEDTPYGRLAQALDPTGAMFKLVG
jgi:predicted enzyme related to lactoylglutathione lyase